MPSFSQNSSIIWNARILTVFTLSIRHSHLVFKAGFEERRFSFHRTPDEVLTLQLSHWFLLKLPELTATWPETLLHLQEVGLNCGFHRDHKKLLGFSRKIFSCTPWHYIAISVMWSKWWEVKDWGESVSELLIKRKTMTRNCFCVVYAINYFVSYINHW